MPVTRRQKMKLEEKIFVDEHKEVRFIGIYFFPVESERFIGYSV